MDAYKDLEIPITLDGREITVAVPLTMELLVRVEEAMKETDRINSLWFRLGKEKSLLDVAREFSEQYLPDSIDRERMQPGLYVLFFSRVKDELMRFLESCLPSTATTAKPPATTGAKIPVERASDSPQAS